MTHKLKAGETVTINLPFQYAIGEEGFFTGKVLETIEDCKNEVIKELEEGLTDPYMIVETPKPQKP